MKSPKDESTVCDAPYCRTNLDPGAGIQYVKDDEPHRVCFKHWRIISETMLWILLIVPMWLLSGCVGEGAWFPLSVESKVGDSFERCVENEGTIGLHLMKTPWVSTLTPAVSGEFLMAEWIFTSRGPACRIIFNEKREAVSVEYTIRNYSEEAMP